MDDSRAAAIYGLYTSLVYLLNLPGGWVADKLWGQRKTVFTGGCIIACGHFSLAGPLLGIPELPSLYTGLVLIILGTSLLKPNVSTMVGDLYPEGGARRDAGFSIFYMGINVGALFGPLVCGALGENVNWHFGFSAAGVGMILGLVQYKVGGRHLREIGILAEADRAHLPERRGTFYRGLSLVIVATVVLTLMARANVLRLNLEQLAQALGVVIVFLALLYFAYLLLAGGHTPVEKKHLVTIFWLFILAALFWSGFEQAGSSLNLFAERLTDRSYFGWEMPASWLQSVNPLFIIIFAPLFGTLWTWLASRNANPSVPVKFSLGLLGLAAGFFVIAWGAANANSENPANPSWLVVTYLLHTWGEVALSPVGLSSITKLAPRGRVGQMMGVWFMASALGNLLAGLFAGRLETLLPHQLFLSVALMTGVAAVIAFLASPLFHRLMGGVE